MNSNLVSASLTFSNRRDAQEFARSWVFHSRRGYTLGATESGGNTSLVLDGLTREDVAWVDAYVEAKNAANPVEP